VISAMVSPMQTISGAEAGEEEELMRG